MSEQPTLPKLLPEETQRRALLEAIVYVAEEPLTLEQIAGGLQLPQEVVKIWHRSSPLIIVHAGYKGS